VDETSPVREPEPPDVQVGEMIAGKYRVGGLLGRGAMGVVVAAENVESGESVAVKLMLPEVAGNREAIGRFTREARAAGEIKSEHTVRVSDVGMLDSGQGYMVMERLEGQDLRAMLDQRGRLPLEEAAGYLMQALEALAQAHAAGIIHRDLKPGNLFLAKRADGTSVLKVLDFGISKVISGALPSDPLTHTSALLGTPMYMSPEQMKAAKNLDARSDIWALGVILYELLAGQAPFQGETLPEVCAQIVLDADPPRAREVVPELPEAIDLVIARCLERSLDKRYQSALELAQALAPFAPSRAVASVKRISRTLSPKDAVSPVGVTVSRSPDGGGMWPVVFGGMLLLAVLAALAWRAFF
jgi:serine/threonine-protein kinase